MTDPAAPAPPDAAPAADLLEAAHAFFPEFGDARPVAGRDHLLLVETPAGRKVVRRWPADAPAARVEATVALLGRLAAAGLPVPRPESLADGTAVLRLGRDRFDARSWLLGSPVGRAAVAYPDPDRWLGLPAVLPEVAFVDAVRVLARLHEETMAPPDQVVSALPVAPLAALPGVVQTAWMETRAALRPIAPRTPAVQRWLAAGERMLPAAEVVLAAADPSLLAPSAVVHQHAWPGHVLVGEGDAVTGLLGWERTAFGTPLLDLAQAIVRLRGWSVTAVEEMVAAQGDVAPLAPELRRLLPAVAGLDLVAASGRLLAAAYAPGPDAPAPPSALRQAAGRLVEGLENAAASLTQAEAKRGTTRRVRPWRRPAQGPKGRRR